MRVKEESEKASLKLNIQKLRSWNHFMANRRGKNGNSDVFYFLVSKITADGDCNHKIKRCLLLRSKVTTNLGSVLKSRDVTLLTKICIIKTMTFPVTCMDVNVGP